MRFSRSFLLVLLWQPLSRHPSSKRLEVPAHRNERFHKSALNLPSLSQNPAQLTLVLSKTLTRYFIC